MVEVDTESKLILSYFAKIDKTKVPTAFSKLGCSYREALRLSLQIITNYDNGSVS